MTEQQAIENIKNSVDENGVLCDLDYLLGILQDFLHDRGYVNLSDELDKIEIPAHQILFDLENQGENNENESHSYLRV
jgi:hypothetical protein